MSYQRCPVCKGIGLVSGGYFIRVGNYNYWSATNASECCRTCNGTGIINELTGLPPKRGKKDVQIEKIGEDDKEN